jgi:cytochrome c5
VVREPYLNAMVTRLLLYTTGAAAGLLLLVGAAGAQQRPKDGEQIMNGACGTCHDSTPIQTAAKSEAEWKETIDRMVTLGATLDDADRPVLLTYLVRSHGPMPDGAGKDIVLNTCTVCHDLARVKQSMHTAEEWEATLIAMLNEGAQLSDENFPIVLRYLSRNFGVK